jgi:hypothetical protein
MQPSRREGNVYTGKRQQWRLLLDGPASGLLSGDLLLHLTGLFCRRDLRIVDKSSQSFFELGGFVNLEEQERLVSLG